MGTKIRNLFICSNCGFESAKWYGKCPGCSEWNTLNEEIREVSKSNSASRNALKKSVHKPVVINEISSQDEDRYLTGLKELDRVLGGGIVKGSLVLLGGDPGIGKSTILLQICNYLDSSLKILYVSGEESNKQLKLRAERLSVKNENLYVMTETDIESIVEQISSDKPDLVIIDSIQTMNHSEISSSTGSVTQVKECTNVLMRVAKSLDIPIIIVGHVNKDGAIAGPKVLEHIVDVVLYFEGERQTSFRILRGIKNRYGSTNEIGVFQMIDSGLKQVDNPSIMLLSGRPKNVSGTCVACMMEGTRPILTEVQGLATTTSFGNPRRVSTGFDYNRMTLILAVLEKRAGYFFSNLDAYINVVGGLKLDEPAADLSVAMALISSLKDTSLGDATIVFGEIGLVGEIRSVSHAAARIFEAARLGFKLCVIPHHNFKSLQEEKIDFKKLGIEVIGVKSVREAFSVLSKS